MTKGIRFSDKDDGDAWEGSAIGPTERVAADIDKGIDDALGLMPITLRLQKSLVEDLKRIAAKNGLGYQPFVRQLLTQYVNEQVTAGAVK
jgi:hypothetical protein